MEEAMKKGFVELDEKELEATDGGYAIISGEMAAYFYTFFGANWNVTSSDTFSWRN